MTFTVYCRPEPQGSTRAFLPKGWKRPIVTTDNQHVLPFRQQIARTAQAEKVPLAGKHQPVEVILDFFFNRPPSAPKKRYWPSVKPDIDKLERAVLDALTGIAYVDDAQVCRVTKEKHYGSPERVVIGIFPMRT